MTNKTAMLNSPSVSPKNIRLMNIAIEAIVAVLLLVWLHTSISKLLDFGGLKIQMMQSPVFTKIPILAAIVGPSLEILSALLLIFKITRLWGMYFSFLLMAFFTWYVAYLMLTMPHLPCACGGIVAGLNWPQHLTLNIFLTILAGLGIFLLRRQPRAGIRKINAI